MRSLLLPAMNAVYPFVELAMSMRGKREVRPVLNARPDTSALKVSLSKILLLQMVVVQS